MKNDDLNMDKIFRDRLKGHSVEPPAHLWDGISGQMIAVRKKKRIAIISRIAAAAVVVFAFLAGWYFNEKSADVIPESVQIESIEKITGQEKASGNLAGSEIESENKETENIGIPIDAVDEDKQKTSGILLADTQNSNDFSQKSNGLEMRNPIKINKIGNFDATLTSDKHSPQSLQNVTKNESEISNTERLLVAENAKVVKDVREKESGWKMGVNIAPGYSSYSSGYSNSYAQNMTYTDSDGDGNISGGISVQYKTGSRWSIESGVYYAQNTQSSINTPQLVALSNMEDATGFSPSAGEKYYFNTTLQVADNVAIMNSAAGIIEFKELPKGAEIAASPEADRSFGIADSYANSLITSGEFSQVFDFVEIPVYLRYLVLDSNFDIELIGGVNAGLIVGNNAFINNNNGVQNVGKTRDISSVNMSGTFGVGVNYALGKHISLAVEPRFSYFLNSINNNPDVDYRPYRIGIYTGLYYEF